MVTAILERYSIKELFHMTHKSNIVSICKCGLLPKNEQELGLGITPVSIAIESVQRRRMRKTLDNGTRIDVHDYVPLYFARDTPMWYVLMHAAPSKGRRALQKGDLVFLCINAELTFRHSGVWFSDGNAASHRTRYYRNINDLAKLDWDTIWSPNEYPNCYQDEWKRKKASEVLVPGCIPLVYIDRLDVQTEETKTELIGELNAMTENESGINVAEIRALAEKVEVVPNIIDQ